MPTATRSSPGAIHARRGLIATCLVAGLLLGVRRDGDSTSALRSGEDLASAELSSASRRASMCTAANATGVGLRGEYFAAESWRGESLLTRVDGPVDFDATLDWPPARERERPRSVRWSGWVKAPMSGSYRFHADAPDLRVWVARQLLVGGDGSPDARLEMAAGRFYPIVIEASRLSGAADRVRLEWTAPHGARYVVPRALLFMPGESVPKPAVNQ